MAGPNLVTQTVRVCRRSRRTSEIARWVRCTTCGWSATRPDIDQGDDEASLFTTEDLTPVHTAEDCERMQTRRRQHLPR